MRQTIHQQSQARIERVVAEQQAKRDAAVVIDPRIAVYRAEKAKRAARDGGGGQ